MDHGADAKVISYNGFNLLHHATNNLREAVVIELLKRGLDPRAKDENGNSCLHYAAFKGVLALLNIIIDNGGMKNIVLHNMFDL